MQILKIESIMTNNALISKETFYVPFVNIIYCYSEELRHANVIEYYIVLENSQTLEVSKEEYLQVLSYFGVDEVE